eukprot:COSAG05_NODE_35_length_27765_cov_221.324719_2_plen_103_part_00
MPGGWRLAAGCGWRLDAAAGCGWRPPERGLALARAAAAMMATSERLRSIAVALQADIDAVRASAALASLGPDLTPAVGYEIQGHCRMIRLERGAAPRPSCPR